jgi:hypothetical protein
MKLLPLTPFATLGLLGLAPGCSSTSSLPAASFELSLAVEGEGSVRSEPTAFDCTGPKECGMQTIIGSAVTLRAAPGKGFGFLGWRRDDAEVAGAQANPQEVRLEVAAGTKTKVRALFIAILGGPGGADAGIAGDSGVKPGSDGGVSLDAGPRFFTCGKAPCATGEACCVTGGRAGAELCRATCKMPEETLATCTSTDDCGASEVCCLDNKNDGSNSTLSCRAASACPVGGSAFVGPLCDTKHPCKTGSCNQFSLQLSFCSFGKAVPE